MRTTVTVAVVALMAVSMASGNLRAYAIDPVRADWSGKADPEDGVSEILTINFDEPITASLFCGSPGAGGSYNVDIYAYPGGVNPLAHGDTISPGDHKWATCTLYVDEPDSFIKGRQVEVRWTRSGADSIQYYYDSTDRYKYGEMPNDIVPNPTDLCMRLYGRMDTVDDRWWASVNFGNEPNVDTALARADAIGIKWLRDDLEKMHAWEDDTHPAMNIYRRYEDRYNVLGILCYGSDDSLKSSRGSKPCDTFWRAIYPPQNLYKSVTSDSNWWAGYCESIMGRMPKFKYWEVWPEANAYWCWRDPDIAHYQGSSGLTNDSIDTPRERCSLYVRMCCIAESTAHALGGGRKVVGGATYRLRDSNEELTVSSGVDWLRDMFDLAEQRYGGIENCFDIASVHPYMHVVDTAHPDAQVFWFDETRFTRDLDTARWALRQAGYPGMELWASEIGWPRWYNKDSSFSQTDTLLQARNLCEFFTSSMARQADPRGGYDRAFWYELSAYRSTPHDRILTEGFGLLDTCPNLPRLPNSWAFEQLGAVLTGKRFNGRVMNGDTAVDNHLRMYEFEDTTGKRTWVCWTDEVAAAVTPVPVRNDEVDTVALAYNSTPPASQKDAEPTGWLNIALQPRPAFVIETGAASRPDLVVDSVKYVLRAPDTVLAWVTNRGNRATPRQSPGNQPYPTWAVLYANGDSLTQQVYTDSIGVSQQVMFTFSPGIAQPAAVLFAVKVNPAQTYVELGTDDNSGYRLKTQP